MKSSTKSKVSISNKNKCLTEYMRKWKTKYFKFSLGDLKVTLLGLIILPVYVYIRRKEPENGASMILQWWPCATQYF